MPASTLLNQTSRLQRSDFERLLAQYRSRVYEANYLTLTNPSGNRDLNRQAQLTKPTILVIEDNADEWLLTRYRLLEQFPQIDCVWLDKAAEVVPYLDNCIQTQTDLPRLLLLDFYLPSVQSGMQVLRDLKAHSLYQSLPTVVLSRSADPLDIAAAFDYAANAYLVKPTEPEQWQTVLAQLAPYWQQPTIGHQPPLSFNDV